MSVFSVPVTIGVDEIKIARDIEQNVESQVVKNITDDIKKLMRKYSKTPYYISQKDEYEYGLEVLVKNIIRDIIKENEQIIIDGAIKNLSDRLIKTKAVKEKLNTILQNADTQT